MSIFNRDHELDRDRDRWVAVAGGVHMGAFTTPVGAKSPVEDESQPSSAAKSDVAATPLAALRKRPDKEPRP